MVSNLALLLVVFRMTAGQAMAVKGLKVGGGGMGEEKTTVGDVGADPGI